MRRDHALAKLTEHREELRRMGARSLALFGPVARDQARPGSDVDVLVEIPPEMGLFGLFHIHHRLEEILGTKVDVVTRSGIHPELRDRIFGEAVDVIPAA